MLPFVARDDYCDALSDRLNFYLFKDFLETGIISLAELKLSGVLFFVVVF